MNMPIKHAENVLSFPKGIYGYEDHNEFQLFSPESENPSVFELQSLTDAAITLSVVSPDSLKLELSITLSDDEQALLDLNDPEDAVIAVIVYKPQEEDVMKAIATAPIIINSKSKRAIQKVLSNQDSVK
jgi:flagellar assembly factor FliW